MRIFAYFFLLFFPCYALAQINPELSEKKLPIFNAPILKDKQNMYLVDKDIINNITYIAETSCSTFKIFAITDNTELLLNEFDLKNIVEAAHDYADIFCPKTSTVVLTVAKNTDLNEDYILFRTVINKTDKWREFPESRYNYIEAKLLNKKNKIKEDIAERPRNDRLAYIMGGDNLDNLPRALLESLVREEEVPITALVFIDGGKAVWPIAASLEVPEPFMDGYYLIAGSIKAKAFAQGTITLDKYLSCKKKMCEEFYDDNNIIKVLSDEEN